MEKEGQVRKSSKNLDVIWATHLGRAKRLSQSKCASSPRNANASANSPHNAGIRPIRGVKKAMLVQSDACRRFIGPRVLMDRPLRRHMRLAAFPTF